MREPGYSPGELADLLRFLELVMPLPDELQEEYERDLVTYERKHTVPAMGQWEKRLTRQGAVENGREVVTNALRARFPDAPASLQERIEAVDDPRKFKRLVVAIIKANSIEDVEQALS